MSKMVIGLASGSIEKLIVASTVIGGAVALDMEVDVYLLLGGARAFRKDVVGSDQAVYDYPQLRSAMEDGLRRNSIPDPFDMLRNLRKDGQVRIHVCATAGKIWGARETSDFVDLVDDIVGIGEYVIKSGEADVAQVL
jgi:peroxiredoxin family protein